MKEVFILESSFGQYDDRRECIEGVYSSLEKAEKRKIEIETQIGFDLLYDPLEDDYDQDKSSAFYTALEFNSCTITKRTVK